MTEDDIFDTLRAYLVAVDAEATLLAPGRPKLVDVIREYQTAPRPARPYAGLSLIAQIDNHEADHRGYEERSIGGESRVVETRTRSFTVKARIDIYGSGSTDFARLFATALRAERAGVDMPGLVVRDVNDASLANELKAQLWESHASLTIELAFLGSNDLLIDVVETGEVEFEGHGATTVRATQPY